MCVAVPAYGKRYKYTIDPSRAEEILAGVTLRPPMFQEDWGKQLGDLKEKTYRIRRGDSMWSISKRMLGDAFLWRKLWQENEVFANPHEIEVGKLLTYYHAGRGLASIEIPVIKLRPGGNATDLEEDSVATNPFKQNYGVGYLVVTGDEFLGEVTGSYSEKEGMSVDDDIYVAMFNKELVKVGDKYAIVHEEKAFKEVSNTKVPFDGTLARIVGEIRVQSIGVDLVRAEVIRVRMGIERGDKIVPLNAVQAIPGTTYPPNDLTVKIVMGEEPAHGILSHGQLILLNKGSEEGVQLGHLFKAIRDTDPKVKRKEIVEPDSKGEVQVVQVFKTASIGYIRQSKEPINVGEELVAYQTIPDIPKPPKRELETIGID